MKRLEVLVLAALLTSCAANDIVELSAEEAVIPCFEAGDPRVETAGFVGDTLRLNRDEGEVRYTLMAFVVGDTLTLGAMVKGGFVGSVRWEVGDRVLAFGLDTSQPLGDVPADGSDLRGQGASFRGTSWVNFELPLDDWVDDGTPIRLRFDPVDADAVSLPADRRHYVARLVRS